MSNTIVVLYTRITHADVVVMDLLQNRQKTDLEVWQTVGQENVPAAEEELLLTDTQQAGHQRIQSLKRREWGDATLAESFFISF